MKNLGGVVRLAATDLSNHLLCGHLTILDLEESRGERVPPPLRAPDLVVIQQRGLEHELAYIRSLVQQGLSVADLRHHSGDAQAVADTLQAMRNGIDVIIQGALQRGTWFGRPDVLRRVDSASDLGAWSYEPYDCKLARQTKAATILQLSHYAALLEAAQGTAPATMYVVPPSEDYQAEEYRVLDYAAFYRAVRTRLEAAIRNNPGTYPEPTEHCGVCRWWVDCDGRWRRDDHLSLTAGISRLQRKQLLEWDVPTVEALARMDIPITRVPRHGSKDGYVRVREQARVQVSARYLGTPVHELLSIEPGRGLSRLPDPSEGDVFFDLESDPFAGSVGREYLFGWTTSGHAAATYERRWAMTAAEEKAAFEWFVDQMTERRRRFPSLHIYHYGHKEPSTLKALMGRYATRENEIDEWLRAGVLVDLHSIARQSVRASVEQYSLKDLEQFHQFTRSIPLDQARTAMRHVEHALELDRGNGIDEDTRSCVESYNADDCRSTESLRDWLETLRQQQCDGGTVIARPLVQDGEAPDTVSERQARVNAVVSVLQAGVPAEPAERTPDQAARWLLSNLLDWHRREDKVAFWEKYRLRELGDEELLEERAAISGLKLIREIPPEGRKVHPLHEYSFPPQETKLTEGDQVYNRDVLMGTIESLDPVRAVVAIRRTAKTKGTEPTSVYHYKIVDSKDLPKSLLRIGESVAERGFSEGGTYRVAADLMLRRPPRLTTGSGLVMEGESTRDTASRLIRTLDGTVLAIQGPPGAGKTYMAARLILEAVRQSKRVGVTATSHKVMLKLLDDLQEAAHESGRASVSCVHKVTDAYEGTLPQWLREEKKNAGALDSIRTGSCEVLTGTAWLWADEAAVGSVDVLFVDEAGQMSLANALAISPAARNLILLGDPQQLEQPLQGSHPDGADLSVLEHLLDGGKTIRAGQGLFLDRTWRLHPSICAFTSEVFYEGRLESRTGLENQRIEGHSWLGQSGLRYLPVPHEGNQNSSMEEVEYVNSLVAGLLQPDVFWVDERNRRERLRPEHILIVAPYNAQVAALARSLPAGVRVGTVDRFQGQEAPVVIYSLTTSTPGDAPRGMEFLYSLNRWNVATSRARALSIVVASEKLLMPECRTPRQLQLANAICRFVEMSPRQEDMPARVAQT